LLAFPGHTAALLSVAVSPDGEHIATSSNDKSVKIWDASTGQEVYEIMTDAPQNDVAYSPDGRYLAAGGANGSTIIWDVSVPDPVELYKLSGHSSFVAYIAFSTDSDYLASASFDGTTKVWDLASGQEWLTLSAQGSPVTAVAFSPDGKRLATSGFDGLTRIYGLDLDELIALARSRLTRSLTLEECQRFLHVEQCPENPQEP
jgi:WD40 repeat protein